MLNEKKGKRIGRHSWIWWNSRGNNGWWNMMWYDMMRRYSENFPCANFFTMFLNLVNKDKYPFHNIALLLWLETVNCFNCTTLHEMRFRNITKDFWRMFHGKFLFFMNEPRGLGTYLWNNSRQGKIMKSRKLSTMVKIRK